MPPKHYGNSGKWHRPVKAMAAVLIIDDDAKHRQVIRRLVEKSHAQADVHEHDAAASGNVEQIADIQQYDLVIMDSLVNGEDTLEWMKTVCCHYEGAPAFVILSSIADPSAADTTRQIVSAIKHGAVNFFFKKKLDMKHLVEDIDKVLDQAEHGPVDQTSASKPAARKDDDLENTMTELHLAMDVVNGHDKGWPFSQTDILAGTAVLGKYRILAYLGEDKTATTFLAEMTSIGKPIVIKLVNRLLMTGKTIPEKFIKRFEAIEHRRHPNIVHLFNYEVVQNRMVMAIEYLKAGTLEQRILDERLDERLGIKLFRQLLDGMATLHELGIELHELMPKQLMFRDEQTMVITHLGLLDQLHALSGITGEWDLPNATPIYTTPEAVQKQPSDIRSDVYLAGLIGFEILTGQPMFSKGSDRDILYAHAAEPPRRLPDPRHLLNKLLQDMLCKIPEQRPQTAGEALKRFDRLYPELKP